MKKQKKISFFHPAFLISTCFGLGKFPILPGTLGSAFACVLLAVLAFFPRFGLFSEDFLVPVLGFATIVFYMVGVRASDIYMQKTGTKDPREIIIDEVSGMFFSAFICVAIYSLLLFWDYKTFYPLLVLSPQYLIVLFFLFRFFDIVKPGIIGKIDREIKGGKGVMLDDIVAGAFAAIAFYIIFFVLVYSGAFLYYFSKIHPAWVQ